MDAPLKFGGQISARPDGPEETVTVGEIIEQLTGFVRRQFPIFIFFIACSLALGLCLSRYHATELHLARDVADRLEQSAHIAATGGAA